MDRPEWKAYIRSPRDYWKVGPVYIWKWLALILLGVGAVSVLTLFGLPLDLLRSGPDGIPAYRYNDPALQEVSGTVQILDEQNRVRYEGEVSAGACTGLGKVYDETGQLVYDGPLVDGVYEGEDAKVYSDGILIYEGAMASNLYEGEGRRTDPGTGVVSVGQFVAGVFEGEGQQFYDDGTLMRSGTFVRELLNGEGQEYDQDGSLLRTGTFRDGLLHGTGTQYTPSGSLEYEGEFQFGIFHGQGKLYDTLKKALTYEGAFNRGDPTGLGRIYHPSGQLLYEGNVYEGQPRADAFLGLSLADVESAFTEHWLLYSYEGTTAFVYPYFHLMFITDIPVELVSPSEQEAQTERERQELLEAIAAQAVAGTESEKMPDDPVQEPPAEEEVIPSSPGESTGEDVQPAETPTEDGTTPEASPAEVTDSSPAARVLSRAVVLASTGPIGDLELSPDTVKSDVLITEVLSYGAPLAGTAQPESDLPSGVRNIAWREWFSDFAAGEQLSGAAAVQTGPFVYEFSALTQAQPSEREYYLALGNGVETTTVYRDWKDSPMWYQSAERRDKER